MRTRAVAWLLPVVLLGSSCTGWLVSDEAEPIATRPLDPAYESFFPQYVELCAVSQYRSYEYGEGGVPGHAVMYLKGACKDETASIPALRPCRGTADRADAPEHGAGISVNKWLSNVNWVATPGRPLFFDGNLVPGDAVDRSTFDRAIQDTLAAGVFEGVELRKDTPKYASREAMIAREFLGTDFGLRIARTVWCARLPVTAEMMGDIIDYLNQINLEYARGEADYDWSGYSDNCAHLIHNALSAASVWRPRSVRVSRLRQLANLSVPANEVIELGLLGTSGPLEDGREVYRDDEARDALLDFDWLPRRHGALVTTTPIWKPNELFDPRARTLVLQQPLSLRATRAARRLAQDPRHTELRPNLEHFRDVYAGILEERDDTLAGGFLPLRSVRYLRPAKRYYGYVEDQLTAVEAMLAELDARETPHATP